MRADMSSVTLTVIFEPVIKFWGKERRDEDPRSFLTRSIEDNDRPSDRPRPWLVD